MRFSFKRAKKEAAAEAVQLRRSGAGGFEMLEGLVPLGGGDVELYRAIREAVPIVDAAVLKLIRLAGGFSVECGNAGAKAELARFIREVDVGRGQRGLQSFLDMYLDSMLTCGRAVGEIVLSQGREIAAVLCGNVRDVLVREGDTPLDFQLCARGGGEAAPFPYQELLLFTPFNPETDSPYGVSLLRSMPFLSEILMKIYACTGANFERSGNVRYAVVYKPSGDASERGGERLRQIAQQWSRAMESTRSGEVRDFVAMGDVEIRAIGADGQVLDSEAPVRQILEQLIAKTGIPPFMLGLSWSSTERMSSQQADMMTSELDALRRTLTPVLEKICRMWMSLHGYADAFEVVWDEINLQDTVEQAQAELYAAQAAKLAKGDRI
ncbi:MAG: phage portal protein [Butyricicoccus sp.]|nr:phage portal protein [Butyricicoccus sp.]